MSISVSLATTIQVALDRARRQNRSVLLSYSQLWQCTDPLAFLAAQGGASPFFWQRGKTLLAAADRLVTCGVQGKDRFTQLGQHLHYYLESYVMGGVCGVPPYFLGAFSFYEDGASLFWLPAWLGRQEEDRSTLTLFHVIEPQGILSQVQADLEGRWAKLSLSSSPSLLFPITPPRSVAKEDRSQWEQVVEKALQYIQEQKLEKVVLARVIEVIGEENFSPFGALWQLRIDHPDCTLFLLELDINKAFLGATPEMLLEFHWQSDRLVLQSDAVAGSAPRGVTAQEDQAWGNFLLQSSKDNREHEMVVRSIREGYAAIGAIAKAPVLPTLLKLHNIQHLYTPITAEWITDRWDSVFAVLAALHPTAAVGGEPRDQALHFIQEAESFDREGYAAPVGWVNGAGEGAFAVAIRSGYLEGNRARIFAGSGIVADSQIDREREETTLKLQALLKALGGCTE